ncbi:DUF1254 domain-containing protein [Vibrio lamellibrachiae]|uniref:DUF1254 domain-containing protein n=1 Tax=Vibrio lamellibrachiae TaxID=2910253 RepID=UPI003D0E6D17
MKKTTKILLGATALVAVIGALSVQHLIKPATQEMYQGYVITHHANFMVDVVNQAGGTNKFIHTRELPTEGTDNVVTPALDHIYSKAVLQLTDGPVFFTTPNVANDRYFSFQLTDQEHYTIMDKYHPEGEFAVVRAGTDYSAAIERVGAENVIVSPSDYPHLFIRVQVYTPDATAEVYPIQDALKIDAPTSKESMEYVKTAPVQWVLETHDVPEKNITQLTKVSDFSQFDYKVTHLKVGVRYLSGAVEVLDNTGLFDHIDYASENHERRAIGVIGHLGFQTGHAIYQPWRANNKGDTLNGSTPHVITLPYDANVDHFWSVTRYDGKTRNTYARQNDVFNAYNTLPDENGNITITFASEQVEDGSYWMPVHDGKEYYYIVRYYGAHEESNMSRPFNFNIQTASY